ncbi:Perilipin-2 [Oryzias melastigma]|uniref:Perilipin-2 n=1 Tax=Oryzias melastigma TaxID=30732 RepID=A0A834CKU0_ORYME|nr:perilipin-2 isoform X1 [Oryzias melastigma]KAF6733513.1 Perilipin-2 [Oryzias melastigma]
MPSNNNQDAVSAAARMAKLPAVRSACAALSILYKDAKGSSPGLRVLCEALESRVGALSTAACSRAAPLMVKLEPQISIANDVACRSLDWLEASFPVIQSPTDQVVASAKTKMHEIRGKVGIAASGTVECLQHTVSWIVTRMLPADGATQSVTERALSLANAGLDLSESLLDQVLPPTEEEKEEKAHLVEGFEGESRRERSRIVSLTVKLYRRTYHVAICTVQSFQDLQTSWNLQALPEYVQHLAVSAFFFITQMYNLGNLSPQRKQFQRRGQTMVLSKPYKSTCCKTTPALRLRPARTTLHNGY